MPSPESAQSLPALAAEALREGKRGLAICHDLSEVLDAALLSWADETLGPELQEKIAVVATGGYGRRETYPHADVDVVVLYDDGLPADHARPVEEAAVRLAAVAPEGPERLEAFVRALRDARLRISLRVRSHAESDHYMREELSIATSMLEARRVWGREDGRLPGPQHIASVLEGEDANGVHAMVTRIREDMIARHLRHGSASHMLEPQVKMGRGGLRDYHALRWVSRLLFGHTDPQIWLREGRCSRPEIEDLQRAVDFLVRTRLALHATGRFRTDQLAFARQADVSRLLGFGREEEATTVEGFMKAFHTNASILGNLAERWLQEWTTPMSTEAVEPLEPGLVLRGGLVDIAEGREIKSLEDAAQALHAAHVHHRHLHPSLRSGLRAISDRIENNAARGTAARRLLRAALLDPEPDAYLLRALLDLGILRKLMPEWAHLVGHTSHDVYHVYTTDRHLFEAFARMVRFLSGDEQPPASIEAAIERLQAASTQWAPALLLSALLHDIGKALDGDHSIIGAGMSHEIARRLSLPPVVRERLRWLVLEHLLMARISQRRDVTDPATHALMARAVPDPEHLDALLVLTWVDMCSVGPSLQSSWKLGLLEQLHATTMAALTDAPHLLARALEERPSVREALSDGILQTQDLGLLREELSDGQWAALEEPEALAAATLLARSHRNHLPWDLRLDVAESAGVAQLTVCAIDSRGLLARLTAAIAAEGINILRARVMTTSSGRAIDLFTLQWSDPAGAMLPEYRQGKLQETLRQILRHEVDPATLRKRWARSAQDDDRRPPVATEVSLQRDADESPTRALIEVKTRDRIGLLADLAARLSELGFEIERSIIAREGDRAIDTFYIRRLDPDAPSWDALVTLLEEDLHGVRDLTTSG